MDRFALFEDVKTKVPAYREFLKEHGILGKELPNWNNIPITTKANYLLTFDVRESVRKGEIDRCFFIGASSGFSKSGTVLWLKGAVDEEAYINAVEENLKHLYSIDRKKTLILVSLAFGTWIGGIQLACLMRSLASRTKYFLTAALPGLDLEEGSEIVKKFKALYDQVLWVTNVSNVPIIYSLLRDDPDLLEGNVYFPVIGEYFTERFRESIAEKFGHRRDEEVALWTGYGSADTGDLGIESRETIALRKLLLRNPGLAQELFESKDVPMIFTKSSDAVVEIIDGDIVVTKDQLIPLIRYNTGDAGGLLHKDVLQGRIPDPLYHSLPDEMLYVSGRVSDSVIFYGTNLKISEINNFLSSLEEGYGYSGLFEVDEEEVHGISVFKFTVYTDDGDRAKERDYQQKILHFLKSYSKEFNAKYEFLVKSSKQELIQIEIKPIREKSSVKKHRYIKE